MTPLIANLATLPAPPAQPQATITAVPAPPHTQLQVEEYAAALQVTSLILALQIVPLVISPVPLAMELTFPLAQAANLMLL
jgi:hypothetical protein